VILRSGYRAHAPQAVWAIVINPSRLIDRQWLRDEIAAMTAYITASPPANPDKPVLIPGDPERRTRAERIANGVPVDDQTWRELVEAARGINVLVELARPSTPSNA
jgi:hydroxycarboxylate dehydrogenase B